MNSFFQGSNFFDNYGRKILGYTLGSSQANNFVDYMQSKHQTDKNILDKLGSAMSFAYSDKYSNTKENKSETKNYKKAIQLVYDWNSLVYGDKTTTTNPSKTSLNLTDKLKKAITTNGSAYDVYNIIEAHLRDGGTYSEVQKALRKISLREQLLTMSDYQKFINSLSDSEYTVIKTALLYEDHMYPYLDDVLEEINSQATREYYQNNKYTSSMKSIIRTMDYNTPEYYSYNSNHNKLKLSTNFFKDYSNQERKYKQQLADPMKAFEQSRRNIDYGVSSDIYGNKTQHYTDGTEYQVRQRGSSISTGGKK